MDLNEMDAKGADVVTEHNMQETDMSEKNAKKIDVQEINVKENHSNPSGDQMILCLCNLSVRKLALLTVALPFLALFLCFTTAYIFRYDDVHETHCRVFNVIPSISAITGITPQIYLWRLCVAFHIGPRILVALLYRNYLKILTDMVVDSTLWFKRSLISCCCWFNIIELSSLCGVTFISNRENYPVHEKLFISFMVWSLTYMIAMTWSFKIVHPSMTRQQNVSYQLKRLLLLTSIVSTFTLIYFFVQHRLYCHDLAFTWFALSEYIIAGCNMGFHLTVAMDFPEERLIVNADFPCTSSKKAD